MWLKVPQRSPGALPPPQPLAIRKAPKVDEYIGKHRLPAADLPLRVVFYDLTDHALRTEYACTCPPLGGVQVASHLPCPVHYRPLATYITVNHSA